MNKTSDNKIKKMQLGNCTILDATKGFIDWLNEKFIE